MEQDLAQFCQATHNVGFKVLGHSTARLLITRLPPPSSAHHLDEVVHEVSSLGAEVVELLEHLLEGGTPLWVLHPHRLHQLHGSECVCVCVCVCVCMCMCGHGGGGGGGGEELILE